MASIKEQLKAGLEITGAVAKTIGKRVIGDDSPTTLSPSTQAVIDEQEKALTPKKPVKKVKK